MSIRMKLVIAYFLIIMLSITIVIASMVKITTDFVGDISKSTIGDRTFQEFFQETINVYVDIEYMSKHEPELFSNQETMANLENRVVEYKMSLYTVEGNEITYASNHLVDFDVLNNIKDLTYENPHGDGGLFESASLTVKNHDYLVTRHVVDMSNPDRGYLYAIYDTQPLNDIGFQVYGKIFRGILVIMAVILLILTVLVTKMIVEPMKRLEEGTIKIRNGNLDFDIKSDKKDEIGRVMNAFDTMRAELKKSIEQQLQYEENRKELITSISHDLKTPITSIKGYVEGIQDGVANEPEKMAKYLEVIYQKSHNLDRLIDDLFLFSKLDLNRVPFNFGLINAKKYFNDSYEELRLDTSKMGFDLKFNNLLKDDFMIEIDPQQFKRVIVNVTQNAMKYSGDLKEVAIQIQNDEDALQLDIRDYGNGIAPEELDSIFEKFYRCDRSRNTNVAGSGLGLAIAKQIMEQHHGRIWAESIIGSGTTIHMTLNRKKD